MRYGPGGVSCRCGITAADALDASAEAASVIYDPPMRLQRKHQ